MSAEKYSTSTSVGTPGLARYCKAGGNVVGKYAAGTGDRAIKCRQVSCSNGAPVTVTQFKFMAEADWSERPDYFNTRPRTGYAMPKVP